MKQITNKREITHNGEVECMNNRLGGIGSNNFVGLFHNIWQNNPKLTWARYISFNFEK